MAVLPVYNVITVPDTNIYFKTDIYQSITGKFPTVDERVTMIVAREDMPRKDMDNDSFYPIGITGVITEVNSAGYLVINTKYRVDIEEVAVINSNTISLSISRRSDIEDLDEERALEQLNGVKSAVVRYSEDKPWGQMMRGQVAKWDNIGQIAAAMSPWMINSNRERYDVLAEDSRQKRSDMLGKMVMENLEYSRVRSEAKSAQEEDYQKIYRESAIKKQMEYLQKELDELHPENVTDVRRMEIRVEESGMNELARKEADKVLARLKAQGQAGAESGMLYDYLDYLTSLPWSKEDPVSMPIDESERILEEDHYGLKKVKKRILQQIAVMNLKGQQSGSILLFVGAPGTGKTSIGRSIARALNREYVRVSLGGARDEADIRGHRRTYIGAMPGRIIDGIQKCGVSNPVMVLDEVDKLGISYNGDPASALLEVLDPEQNNTFTDHYLNVPYDLSDVFFICTANSLETIPQPLLDRMEVIQFQGYTQSEKEEIARRHLLPKALEAVGIEDGRLEVDDEAIALTISDYTREGGVRGLKKRMDTICRTAAVELVRDPEQTIRVTAENLRDYLDATPMHHKDIREAGQPGIVTGLAWTSVGGEILDIETMFSKGSGKIRITGQLGDVMKESAQIAVSMVKHLYPTKADLFNDNDLHIHVPDGATPKDGPSAGITLTTALASLVNGIAVDPAVAMTGEISLQGNVKPIGGLPEKLMAGLRAGVKKVFIPKDNAEDLRDVPQEVKDALEIVPVRTISEVLDDLGIRHEEPELVAI